MAALPEGVQRPVIDGVLDEEAWAHANLLGELRQVEPVAGATPSERTEVRLLQDDRSVFLGITCLDSQPGEIRATQMLRDARLDPDDRVEFLFDTFLDRRNAFWFQVGAGGSKGDALIAKNGSNFNKDFDAIWYAQARVTDQGWVAEIEVPAASLNFDSEKGAWGFNLRRHIRRRSEVARWANADPRHNFFAVSQAGTLTGVGPLSQGLGLDVAPFLVGDWSTDRVESWTEFETDAGLDVFYRITPSTKLSLSFNTDFAETEVDQRVVNLTRFALFFPEKRDFFLEDSGAFFFGARGGGPYGGSPDVLPFFSRRIGLDAEGQEVPLLAAAKLTGSTDSYSFGLLDVQTDDTETVEARNLSVGRFSKNILEQSDIGMIVTAGDSQGGGGEATVGADLNLRTDTFLGGRNLNFSSFVIGSIQEEASDQNLAYYAALTYPNDEVFMQAKYTVVERNFDPALGFVRRSDMKKYETRLRYEPRMYSGIRKLEFSLEPVVITDGGNHTESVKVTLRPLGVEWESGEEFGLDLVHQREVLDEAFDVLTGVEVSEGAYTYDRVRASFETSSKRDLSAEISLSGGGFYDGDRADVEVELDWRASKHAVLGAEYEVSDIDLPGGDFRVHTARLQANALFTAEISWSNYLQYDNVSDDLGLNSRLRWILSPGREVNVVVNQNWRYEAASMTSLSSEVVAKIAFTMRF